MICWFLHLRRKRDELSFQPIQPALIRSHEKSRYLGQNRFRLLNEECAVDKWSALERSPLWNFNLHYFDYLFSELGSAHGLDLIDSWLREVDEGHKIAWHSYPTSRRVANWIFYFSNHPGRVSRGYLESLRVQLDLLRLTLERDLLGNHLIANAQALVLGGAFFGDQKLTSIGLDILAEQLPEQIQGDGSHYEHSPMYHAIVLEDLLNVVSAMKQRQIVVPDWLMRSVSKMSEFLGAILFDGRFPLLNDCAEEIAADPIRLLEASGRLGAVSSVSNQKAYLENSGLCVFRSARIGVVFDVGRLGPDFLLGHAHNDTLSILIYYEGQPILTDSGCAHYQGPLRHYFRSAKSHNVVMIAEMEPNELWSNFRVGRRGYPSHLYVDMARGIIWGSHSGYSHLGWRVSRGIFVRDSFVAWIDIIDGTQPIPPVQSFLHFAPGIDISIARQDVWQINGGRLTLTATGYDRSYIESSKYSAEFGHITERKMLQFEAERRSMVELRSLLSLPSATDAPSGVWDQLLAYRPTNA
ncbi:MAG: hypothetical protein DCC75_01385 [Proteobacteria bacterium]|nr:MAG: hypothetical protein DCC75_01385 [Pseudomonadota bacterium]